MLCLAERNFRASQHMLTTSPCALLQPPAILQWRLPLADAILLRHSMGRPRMQRSSAAKPMQAQSSPTSCTGMLLVRLSTMPQSTLRCVAAGTHLRPGYKLLKAQLYLQHDGHVQPHFK